MLDVHRRVRRVGQNRLELRARGALGRRRPPALDGARVEHGEGRADFGVGRREQNERAEQRRRARVLEAVQLERADELAGEAEVLPPQLRRLLAAEVRTASATSSAYARSESIVPEPRRRREPSVCISSRKCS